MPMFAATVLAPMLMRTSYIFILKKNIYGSPGRFLSHPVSRARHQKALNGKRCVCRFLLSRGSRRSPGEQGRVPGSSGSRLEEAAAGRESEAKSHEGRTAGRRWGCSLTSGEPGFYFQEACAGHISCFLPSHRAAQQLRVPARGNVTGQAGEQEAVVLSSSPPHRHHAHERCSEPTFLPYFDA